MCGVPGSRVDFERRGRGNKGFPVSSCKPCKIDYLGISGAETVAFFEYKFRSNADEEKFLDQTKFKAVVLGEVHETTS